MADRTRETLENHIVDNIEDGTHIVSDGWPSYCHIDEIDGFNYSHGVVIHNDGFMNPETGEHTNEIEGTKTTQIVATLHYIHAFDSFQVSGSI